MFVLIIFGPSKVEMLPNLSFSSCTYTTKQIYCPTTSSSFYIYNFRITCSSILKQRRSSHSCHHFCFFFRFAVCPTVAAEWIKKILQSSRMELWCGFTACATTTMRQTGVLVLCWGLGNLRWQLSTAFFPFAA